MILSVGLLVHAVYLMLRVQGSGGAFPRPLSPEEEADCIARMAAGDHTARDALIEHNLRLVAHIAKKGAHKGSMPLPLRQYFIRYLDICAPLRYN